MTDFRGKCRFLLDTVVTEVSDTATQSSTLALTATLLSTVGVTSVLTCATGTADTLYWIVVPKVESLCIYLSINPILYQQCNSCITLPKFLN